MPSQLSAANDDKFCIYDIDQFLLDEDFKSTRNRKTRGSSKNELKNQCLNGMDTMINIDNIESLSHHSEDSDNIKDS